jgi:hypothetical protein
MSEPGGERSLRALLLAAVIATSEIAQTGAWHTGRRVALGVHQRPAVTSLLGIAAITGAATAVVHDATLAAVLIGLAAAAALLAQLLTQKLLREQRLPPEC